MYDNLVTLVGKGTKRESESDGDTLTYTRICGGAIDFVKKPINATFFEYINLGRLVREETKRE